MAVSLEFLSKTKMGAMKDIMASKSNAGIQQKQNGNNNQIFGQKTQDKQPKADLANMNSSDLMKYVYNNTAGQQDNNSMTVPARVDYNNQKFNTNGKTFDDAVKMIAEQTGDSTSKIEQELKKQCGAKTSGGSLNFQA